MHSTSKLFSERSELTTDIDGYIVAFKTKTPGDSLFTVKNIKEMNRFYQHLTAIPLWSKLCYFGDTGSCDTSAYFNYSKIFLPDLKQNTLTQYRIDELLIQSIDDDSISSYSIDKNFKRDHLKAEVITDNVLLGYPLYENGQIVSDERNRTLKLDFAKQAYYLG